MRRSRKYLLMASVVLAVTALAVYWIVRPRPDPNSLQYHFKRWYTLRNRPGFPPTNLRGWLHPQTVSWLLEGRPGFGQWWEEFQHEQSTLISMGYFEERRLPWSPDHRLAPRLAQLLNPSGSELGRKLWTNLGYPTNEILVTGRPADIKELEVKVRSILGSP